MSCPQNFTEWTREQKEELAERRMREMKEKNEKYLKRYAEVEHDRREAEINNSAITNVPKGPKKETKYEVYKTESKSEYTREWDRGKPDKDNWKSPEHRGSFKSYRTARYEKNDVWSSRNEGNERDSWHDHTSAGYQERKDFDRNDTWGNFPRNENSDHYRHDRSTDIMQNRRTRGNYRSDQQNLSRFHKSPKRSRGVGYRNNEPHRNSQHSYSDEKYKKSDYNRPNSRRKYSYRAHSRSSSRSESDFVGNNTSNEPVSSIKASSLWQNDKINEDQTKQNRVEKWVNSVNKSNWGRGKPFPPDRKEQSRSRSSKFNRFERSSSGSSSENKFQSNCPASGENRSRENNNTAFQKPEFYSNKQQNMSAFSRSAGSSSIRQNDRNKTFKTKYSSQYNSASSDHFRKRRFENKGFKNDERHKFVKCIMNNNVSWNNSVIENRFTKKESSYSNTDTWNHSKDNWETTVQSSVNNDTWETVEQSQADDGWETAEQSDIKWKISDDEKDSKETENKNMREVNLKKNSLSSLKVNITSDEKVEEKPQNDNKQVAHSDAEEKQQSNNKQVASINEPEDMGADVQQDKGQLDTAEGKSETTDGWEDYESSSNLNEISEKMEKNCKIRDKAEAGGDVKKIIKSTSGSNVKSKKPEQKSCVLPKKSLEKNPAGSDGWSTVSEEGEIHSDDPDSEWKKDDSI